MSTKAFFKNRSGKRRFGTVTLDGETIRLRSLLFPERQAIYRRFIDEDGEPTREDYLEARQALFCIYSIVDTQGNLIHSDSEEDINTFINLDDRDMKIIDEGISELNVTRSEELKKLFQLEAADTTKV